MKIHSLTVNNIASLQGQHSIDFDKISNTSHIYAITGKTGSGKSSLLNSISLALYGEVYKRGSQATDFVTLGEDKAEISLTFSNRSTMYRADWKCKVRKKNGELLKQPQQNRLLYKIIDGEEVALEILPQEVINLSFNEFCKTTVLNQGEFAKFLTSRFNERKLILEKFYEGDDLLGIALLLKNKIKEFDSILAEFRHKIIGLQESVENIKINQAQIKDLEREYKQKEGIYKILESAHKHIEDFCLSVKSYNQNKERTEKLKTEIHENTSKLNQRKKEQNKLQEQLLLAQTVINEKKPILSEAIEKQVALSAHQTEFSTSKLEQEKIMIQIKNNKDLNQKINEEHALLDENIFNYEDNCPLIKEISLDKILEVKQQAIIAITKIESHSKNIKNLQTEVKNLEVTGKSLVKEKGEYQERILKITPNKEKITQIEQLNSQLNELDIKLQEHNLKKEKVEKEVSSNKKKLEVLQTESITIKQNLESNKKDLSDIKSQLQESKLDQSKLLCLEESIKLESCVICGSDHLPKQLLKINSSFKNIELLHADELSLLDTIQEIEKKEFELESKIKNTQNINKNLFEDIEQKKLELTKLFCSLQQDASLDQLPELIHAKKRDYELLKEALVEVKVLESKVEKNTSLITEQRIRYKKVKEELEHSQLELRKQEVTLKSNLAPLSLSMKEDHLAVKLRDIAELATNYQKALQAKQQNQTKSNHILEKISELLNRSSKMLIKQDELQKNINKLNSFISSNCKDNKPREELNALENDLSLAQTNINSSYKEINIIEISLAELKSKLNSLDDLNKNHIAHIRVIKNDLPEMLNKLSKEVKDLPELIHNVLHFDIDNDSPDNKILSYTSESSFKIFKEFSKELEAELNTFTTQKALFSQKLDAIQQVDKYNLEIGKKTKDLNKYVSLNQVIGKDEFRNYILSIIEKLLIDQTNHELQTLCNQRYKIIPFTGKSNQASEFQIIDYYHDASIRKISTLSGGETFLVSLAMAMALAELTRGSTQIDSLFIDEGFGTLDSEAIEEVFELLINIENTGRQIGIISHVQHLTERIPVNIHLHKSQLGLSDIQIKFN